MKKPIYYRKFDYNRQWLPNPYLAELELGVNSLEEATKRTGYTVGYPGWNLLYYAVLCHLEAKKRHIILETGSNVGCSTIILAQALRDSGGSGRVYTIEANPEAHARAKENLKAAKLDDLVVSLLGDSKQKLEELLPELNEKVCVAFLDASHSYKDVLREFEMVQPVLQEDGIVIFDNTYPLADPGEDPLVHGALKEILRRYGGHLVNFPYASWYTPGIAIWQARPWAESVSEEQVIGSPVAQKMGIGLSALVQASSASVLDPGKFIDSIGSIYPLLTEKDIAKGLENAFRLQRAIEGRCCGDVGDRMAQYGAWLQYLREHKDVARPTGIEIGTLFGGSSVLMLEAMRDERRKGHLVCIDPMTGFYDKEDVSGVMVSQDVFRRNMEASGFDSSWYDLRCMMSHATDARREINSRSCGVLLIDGDHSYEGVKRDWELYRELVADGGFVLFDDYSDPAWPGVTSCVDDIAASLPNEWSIVGQLGTTFILCRKNTTARPNPQSTRRTDDDEWAGMVSALLESFRMCERVDELNKTSRYQNQVIDGLKTYLTEYRNTMTTKQNELMSVISDMVSSFVRKRWQRLITEDRLSSVCLFGAGKHTGWLLDLIGDLPGPRILGILDDCAPEGDMIKKYPIVKPEIARDLPFDAIVLSTDSKQDLFMSRCKEVFSPDVRVVDLYEGLPPHRPLMNK